MWRTFQLYNANAFEFVNYHQIAIIKVKCFVKNGSVNSNELPDHFKKLFCSLSFQSSMICCYINDFSLSILMHATNGSFTRTLVRTFWRGRLKTKSFTRDCSQTSQTLRRIINFRVSWISGVKICFFLHDVDVVAPLLALKSISHSSQESRRFIIKMEIV